MASNTTYATAMKMPAAAINPPRCAWPRYAAAPPSIAPGAVPSARRTGRGGSLRRDEREHDRRSAQTARERELVLVNGPSPASIFDATALTVASAFCAASTRQCVFCAADPGSLRKSARMAATTIATTKTLSAISRAVQLMQRDAVGRGEDLHGHDFHDRADAGKNNRIVDVRLARGR
jgi:hypothetical protein